MNLLYKLLLTINATSWMLVVYGIKEGMTIWNIPKCLFGVGFLCIPIILSFISIGVSSFLGTDSLGGCQELSLADNDIEESKETYYEALQDSSINWHENGNDYRPFTN